MGAYTLVSALKPDGITMQSIITSKLHPDHHFGRPHRCQNFSNFEAVFTSSSYLATRRAKSRPRCERKAVETDWSICYRLGYFLEPFGASLFAEIGYFYGRTIHIHANVGPGTCPKPQ